MGSIGKKLPKVLWPVFEKSLLELQVAYARSLGAEKIYINLHYMGKEIEDFCRSKFVFEGVTFLWEKPEILDIGGAIHNLAAQPEIKYKGKLLVLNADQFFYLKKEDLQKILAPYEKSECLLFTYKVNSTLGYNALEVDENRNVQGIIKNQDLPQNKTIETYTGISYIDLSKLEKRNGSSAFFDSVCDFKEKNIPAISLENMDYWDFGTIKRYWETTFNILKTYRVKSVHPFIRFLVSERALKTWKIDLQKLSYHAKSPEVVNLNPDEEVNGLNPAIILAGKEVSNQNAPTIWWNGLSEEVK